jgi:hypothetical protein
MRYFYLHSKTYVQIHCTYFRIHLAGLTACITPWSRALLEKLPFTQLLKNFPKCHGTRSYIILFTSGPPLVPIPSQMNPVYTTPFHFSNMHFNIILSPTFRSSKWFPSFWLSFQNPVCTPLRSHACYITRPSSLISYSNDI